MPRFPLHPDKDAMPTRQDLLQQLFPSGVPSLWCPPLTHYRDDGSIDSHRISAHLKSIAPFARGWLIPGSTGDGWEMTDGQVRQLLDHTLPVAREVGASVLIGVLSKDGQAARNNILRLTDWLCERQQQQDVVRAMFSANVCGFTVCPPAGAELSQKEIKAALDAILDLGLPVALYQLPQVTENEMAPETVESLAQQHANFFLFKDTSGEDRVATSSANLEDVFLVRGAEGKYALWLKSAAGPYDGFLLSTANVFAEQYAGLIHQINSGEISAAEAAIRPVEEVVQIVFDAALSLPDGNPFTNANKAMDHVRAFGANATAHRSPKLHAGSRLPQSIIEVAWQAMSERGLAPAEGYWAGS